MISPYAWFHIALFERAEKELICRWIEMIL
jgi:hypothetical protein